MDNKNPFMLTTTDNPYSPFDEWPRWLIEDARLGHCTPGLIDRYMDDEEAFDVDPQLEAMSRIIEHNVSGRHIMVVREDYNPNLSPELRALAIELEEK